MHFVIFRFSIYISFIFIIFCFSFLFIVRCGYLYANSKLETLIFSMRWFLFPRMSVCTYVYVYESVCPFSLLIAAKAIKLVQRVVSEVSLSKFVLCAEKTRKLIVFIFSTRSKVFCGAVIAAPNKHYCETCVNFKCFISVHSPTVATTKNFLFFLMPFLA